MKSADLSFPLLSSLVGGARSLTGKVMFKRPFGLKAKIMLLIIFNVAGVLLFSSYLEFHLARKDLIDLYLNRNLYIAKQIDVGIPDQMITTNLFRIHEEVEVCAEGAPKDQGK